MARGLCLYNGTLIQSPFDICGIIQYNHGMIILCPFDNAVQIMAHPAAKHCGPISIYVEDFQTSLWQRIRVLDVHFSLCGGIRRDSFLVWDSVRGGGGRAGSSIVA